MGLSSGSWNWFPPGGWFLPGTWRVWWTWRVRPRPRPAALIPDVIIRLRGSFVGGLRSATRLLSRPRFFLRSGPGLCLLLASLHRGVVAGIRLLLHVSRTFQRFLRCLLRRSCGNLHAFDSCGILGRHCRVGYISRVIDRLVYGVLSEPRYWKRQNGRQHEEALDCLHLTIAPIFSSSPRTQSRRRRKASKDIPTGSPDRQPLGHSHHPSGRQRESATRPKPPLAVRLRGGRNTRIAVGRPLVPGTV